MSKVVSISGGPIPVEGPDPEVIAHIEDLMERARRGEIKEIAVAWVSASGRIGNSWQGRTDGFVLMGAISMLNHDYLSSASECSVSVPIVDET